MGLGGSIGTIRILQQVGRFNAPARPHLGIAMKPYHYLTSSEVRRRAASGRPAARIMFVSEKPVAHLRREVELRTVPLSTLP
jgi:hypothetical protein